MALEGVPSPLLKPKARISLGHENVYCFTLSKASSAERQKDKEWDQSTAIGQEEICLLKTPAEQVYRA